MKKLRLSVGTAVRSILHVLVCAEILLIANLLHGCKSSKEGDLPMKNPNGRNDLWGFTGFGGGGAMFYPAISPHNSDYVYVACDMTGSYVTYNGGESWRMFSLRGPVKYFVFDPVDPDIVYAKSIALFRSTDRGNTWNILYPGPSEIKGFVAKGDHAEERIITNDATRRDVLAFAVDPDNSMNLHAAISIDNYTAYYHSTDQGRHWTKERELENGVKNIFIDPSSPGGNRTIYVTGTNSITVREKGTWKTNAAPENVGRINEYSGGFDKQKNKYIIYAISGKSYFNPEGDISGIYYSEDGGKTWENRQNDLLKLQINNADSPEWRTISASNSHPEVVYVSYAGLKVHKDTTCTGVARSGDCGRTWKPVSKDIGEAAITHILIDKSSSKEARTLYACAFGKGVYKSTNGGISWVQKNNGIEGEEPFAWRISREEKSGKLFLVVCRRSDDGSIGNKFDGALYRSSDGAESWTKIKLPEGTNGPMDIIIAKDNPDRMLLSAWGRIMPREFSPDTGGGVFLPEDNGLTWKQTLERDQHIHDITYDNRNNTFYACGFNGSAYRSEDRGETWYRIKGFNFKWGKRVEPDPADPEKIYIVTFGGGIWYGPARGDENAVEDIEGNTWD